MEPDGQDPESDKVKALWCKQAELLFAQLDMAGVRIGASVDYRMVSLEDLSKNRPLAPVRDNDAEKRKRNFNRNQTRLEGWKKKARKAAKTYQEIKKIEKLEAKIATLNKKLSRSKSKAKSSMEKEEAKCFNCDKPGHFARECPHPKQASGPRG